MHYFHIRDDNVSVIERVNGGIWWLYIIK
jgi:hypothetical protein